MTELDASRIRRSLMGRAAQYLDRIEVFSRIDSTNSYLKDQSSPPPGQFRIVIAEHQTAGRGRHDKQWISSPGGSLCLSLSYRFQQAPQQLSALTLALGAGIAGALSAAGVADLGLKWPNDLLVGDSKLGGILTETLFRGDSDVTVIAGIGINIDLRSPMDEAVLSGWANSATSLNTVMADPPSRERLSEIVIEALMLTFQDYESNGFESFADQYKAFDWLMGKELVVGTPKDTVSGIAAGVADDGALLVDTASGLRKIHAGSVKQVSKLEGGS